MDRLVFLMSDICFMKLPKKKTKNRGHWEGNGIILQLGDLNWPRTTSWPQDCFQCPRRTTCNTLFSGGTTCWMKTNLIKTADSFFLVCDRGSHQRNGHFRLLRARHAACFGVKTKKNPTRDDMNPCGTFYVISVSSVCVGSADVFFPFPTLFGFDRIQITSLKLLEFDRRFATSSPLQLLISGVRSCHPIRRFILQFNQGTVFPSQIVLFD